LNLATYISTVLVFLLEISFKYGRLSSYRAGIAQYVTILRVERRGKLITFLEGARFLSSPQNSQFHGSRDTKRSRNGTDHSSPFIAAVKNTGSHTAKPPSPTYLHDMFLNYRIPFNNLAFIFKRLLSKSLLFTAYGCVPTSYDTNVCRQRQPLRIYETVRRFRSAFLTKQIWNLHQNAPRPSTIKCR